MRVALFTLGSIVLTTTVIGNAYFQKKQFYPSVVYITKSNPSMAVIYLQAFVLVLLMGKLVRKVFFGQLRAAEMEHLIERSWYAVTETCLAFTVFREDFSPKFVALFTLLLFLKCFHWLAEDRVDYMERSPVISWLFHFRVASLLMLLGGLDNFFVGHAYQSTLTKGASVQLVFGFEYAILFTVVMNILVKYALHTVDLQRENPWENKAVYLLYTELLMGFVKVVLYLTFMFIMIKIHTFPLFAIRPMYLSMRAFKKAVNDVIMSRRAIRNMNTLYPDATPEELASSDNVCIICREEMTGIAGGSKKLPCNHIFHSSCLRSWFQRQQTCPTCRMDVLRLPLGRGPLQRGAEGAAAVAAAAAGAGQGGIPPAHPQGQPQMPNWPAMAGGGGAGFPAPFPFMFAMQQQQQQPPAGPQPSPGSSSQPQTGTNQTGASTSTTGAPGAQQSSFFLPPVPLFPFCFLPPPPLPNPDFSGLSMEELQAMEGQERDNVEARIKCLRNIQTLLDAAVLQMQQYSSLVNTLRPTVPSNASANSSGETPSTSGAETSGATKTDSTKPNETLEKSKDNPTTSVPPANSGPSASSLEEASASSLEEAESLAGPSHMDDDLNSSDPQSEVRRRRIEKFSQENNLRRGEIHD